MPSNQVKIKLSYLEKKLIKEKKENTLNNLKTVQMLFEREEAFDNTLAHASMIQLSVYTKN